MCCDYCVTRGASSVSIMKIIVLLLFSRNSSANTHCFTIIGEIGAAITIARDTRRVHSVLTATTAAGSDYCMKTSEPATRARIEK